MTDRELLELAAKAAGYEVRWHENWQCLVHEGPHNTDTPATLAGQRLVWVPLTDDGDALRLAVSTGVMQGRGFDNAWNAMFAVGKLPKDKFEATRRAIVRAAAEIGRAMT